MDCYEKLKSLLKLYIDRCHEIPMCDSDIIDSLNKILTQDDWITLGYRDFIESHFRMIFSDLNKEERVIALNLVRNQLILEAKNHEKDADLLDEDYPTDDNVLYYAEQAHYYYENGKLIYEM